MVDSIDANRFKVRLNYLSQINEVEFIVAELLDHPVYIYIYIYIYTQSTLVNTYTKGPHICPKYLIYIVITT